MVSVMGAIVPGHRLPAGVTVRSLIDFICRVLRKRSNSPQDGSMTRLSGDTPHNRNAATISHKSTFLQGYLLFSQFF